MFKDAWKPFGVMSIGMQSAINHCSMVLDLSYQKRIYLCPNRLKFDAMRVLEPCKSCSGSNYLGIGHLFTPEE
jgi:hypothetical protein